MFAALASNLLLIMLKEKKIAHGAILSVIVIVTLLFFLGQKPQRVERAQEKAENKVATASSEKKVEQPKDNPKIEIKENPANVVYKEGLFRVSAYSASAEEGTADGITASGVRADIGTCAADTRLYPFGTRFYIPDYGDCIVWDTGGAIIGNRIDVFYPTREQAFRWGVRTLQVKIY